MALSLFASALPKALRAAPKKSSSLPRRRFCTAKPKGEVAKDGDISTMVMPTRVFLPSPLMRSRLPDTPVYDSPEEIAKEGALTVQQKQDIMVDRLKRFRQAILDTMDAAGVEWEHDLGPNEFPQGPLTLKGSFGTPDKPMLVPSFENERLVGCQGGAGPRHHETLWHNVKKNKPLCCLECGQIFRLVDHMEWLEWAATEWDVNKQNTIQFFLPDQE